MMSDKHSRQKAKAEEAKRRREEKRAARAQPEPEPAPEPEREPEPARAVPPTAGVAPTLEEEDDVAILRRFYTSHPAAAASTADWEEGPADGWSDAQWQSKCQKIVATYEKRARKAAKKGKTGPEADARELMYQALHEKYGADPRAPQQAAAGPDRASLLAELQGLRMMAVHARALEAGVATETLDDAMELDDPKLAIMELIINAACGVA